MKHYLSLILLWLTPLLAQAAPDGATLFSQNCAACHGAQGHGGVGVPLALPAFVNSVPDDYLTQTIHLGRPGRVMPSFTQLSDEEVAAIVAYLRSWATDEHISLPTGEVRGDPSHGKALFTQHCAVCHGPNGEGGHGTGVTFSRPRDLPIIAPGLNNPGFLGAASDQMIKATLMNGRPGTPMVSFLEQGLTEQDINDVVAFLRSLEKNPITPRAPKNEAPVLVMESPYSFEETVENVKRAAIGKNFRIIREQYLEDGLQEPGQENKKQMLVYFCNFKFLNDALALDPRVGLFLPCRVTVIEQDGKVQVMSINPEHLSTLFNNVELDRACAEMHNVYEAILEEATL